MSEKMKCPLCGSPQKKQEFVKNKIKELQEFNEKNERNKNKIDLLKIATSVSISHHAIDRMSTRHENVYKNYRVENDQGIVTWMRETSMEILNSGQLKNLQEQVKNYGLKWIFQRSKNSTNYRLMTVTPINKKRPNIFGRIE